MSSYAIAALQSQRGLTAYARVGAHVLEQIRSGKLAPGDRLPTQAELAEAFGVSRITVIRALQALESDGVIERRQGVGTFVARRGSSLTLTSASQLYKQTFEGDDRPRHALVAVDVLAEPPARVHGTLDGCGDLWHVVRLRLRDGRAVSYEESFIPRRWVPPGVTPHVLEQSLVHDFLTVDCGIPLVSTRVYVAATTIGPREADLLGAAVGDSGLLITRVPFGRDGRAVSCSLNTLPADVSSYYFEFHHSGEEALRRT